ncbi:MAG: TolC family protein [Rhodothermales bacterium]
MPLPRTAFALLTTVVIAGCATVRPQEAFDDVEAIVAERSPYRVAWTTDSDEDGAADTAVADLLADSLTADEAVQIALLNNRRLQATYEDLGVAQANLVQAGLLSNPVFGARALWPLEESGPPDLGFNVAVEFLEVFYLPLRKRIARSELEAAQLRVASAVLDLAARTRSAYVRAQADAARLAMQRRVVANAEAGYEASRLLREAGNVPATDLLAEQALYEQARLDLLVAEGAAVESREALVRLMGLFGEAADLRLASTLPPVPETEPELVRVVEGAGESPNPEAFDTAALERAALEASLDLAAARQDLVTFGHRIGLATPEALLPELEVGGEIEREEGEWEAGPEVEIVLLLFDQGQARRAALRAELRRRQALYYAVGVEVRSAARTLAQRLATTRRTALQYERVLLPLRAELVAQTLLRYNAMQTGVFGLLQAQQLEIDAARRYFDALAAYWEARADLDLLLQGRMPALDGTGLALPSGGGPAMRDAGH